MKLITELTEEYEFISESKEVGKGKDHFIKGTFLQAMRKNKNGRIYPLNVLEQAVDKYNLDKIAQNRAWGELGHPDGPKINLDRVSHIITELKQDGENFIGKAKITDTPMGNIVKGLLSSGGNLGVSSRGMGTLVPKDGTMIVQGDFFLATAADIVADPSGPNCYVNGILENIDWIYDEKNGWEAIQMVEDQKKQLENTYKSLTEEDKFKLFNNFIKAIVSK